jgi:hypothetical protein
MLCWADVGWWWLVHNMNFVQSFSPSDAPSKGVPGLWQYQVCWVLVSLSCCSCRPELQVAVGHRVNVADGFAWWFYVILLDSLTLLLEACVVQRQWLESHFAVVWVWRCVVVRRSRVQRGRKDTYVHYVDSWRRCRMLNDTRWLCLIHCILIYSTLYNFTLTI